MEHFTSVVCSSTIKQAIIPSGEAGDRKLKHDKYFSLRQCLLKSHSSADIWGMKMQYCLLEHIWMNALSVQGHEENYFLFSGGALECSWKLLQEAWGERFSQLRKACPCCLNHFRFLGLVWLICISKKQISRLSLFSLSVSLSLF